MTAGKDNIQEMFSQEAATQLEAYVDAAFARVTGVTGQEEEESEAGPALAQQDIGGPCITRKGKTAQAKTVPAS